MEEKQETGRTEVTEELLRIGKKTLLHARLRTLLLVLAVVPGLLLLAAGVRSVRETERITAETAERLGEAGTLSEDVHRIAEQSASLNAAASKLLAEVDPAELKELVDSLKDALEGVSEAAKSASRIDPEAVNGLLRKLDGELDGLSGALDSLSRLDPEKINNLLARLDEVMKTLDRLSAALDKLSGFKLFG